MCKFIALLLFVAGLSAVATADEDISTGNYLLHSCQMMVRYWDRTPSGYDDDFREGLCVGQVRAILWKSQKICTGSNVTDGQAVRVVTKYLESHPEVLDTDGNVLVERALSTAFPCPSK